eukprot:Rhum_TRINITY_DN14890_c11_g1::Rhum_TRINITY_DN14890_c11_g1_i2::g.126612::m.126612
MRLRDCSASIRRGKNDERRKEGTIKEQVFATNCKDIIPLLPAASCRSHDLVYDRSSLLRKRVEKGFEVCVGRLRRLAVHPVPRARHDVPPYEAGQGVKEEVLLVPHLQAEVLVAAYVQVRHLQTVHRERLEVLGVALQVAVPVRRPAHTVAPELRRARRQVGSGECRRRRHLAVLRVGCLVPREHPLPQRERHRVQLPAGEVEVDVAAARRRVVHPHKPRLVVGGKLGIGGVRHQVLHVVRETCLPQGVEQRLRLRVRLRHRLRRRQQRHGQAAQRPHHVRPRQRQQRRRHHAEVVRYQAELRLRARHRRHEGDDIRCERRRREGRHVGRVPPGGAAVAALVRRHGPPAARPEVRQLRLPRRRRLREAVQEHHQALGCLVAAGTVVDAQPSVRESPLVRDVGYRHS